MEKHPIGELMNTTMQKIREMVDVNEIVGTPIVVQDGVTIIPVSKVSFGFASGGSDFQGKRADPVNPFGGGAGAGVKMEPVAFIVIRDGNVRLLNIGGGEPSLLDKIVDMAPDFVNKVADTVQKKKAESAAPAEPAAESVTE